MNFVPLQGYESFKMIHPFLFYLPQWITPVIPVSQQGRNVQNCIVIEDDEDVNKSQCLQEDFKPRKKLRIEEFDEYDPYVQISVYRQHQSKSPKQYILQKDVYFLFFNQIFFRIVGSMAEEKDITIGKSDCDIQLPHGDKNIEKIHCKIITDKGFHFASQLTTPMLTFLSLRYDKNSPVSRLPLNIMKLIHSFQKSAPQFSIMDVGTQAGTYVKVKKDKYTEVLNENSYLIGADTQFHVLTMRNQQNPKPNRSYEYFMQALVREKNKDVQIHGLNQIETQDLIMRLEEYKNTKMKSRCQFKLINCDRPFLKVEFISPMWTYQHIFIANYNEEKTFKIGRSQECDVIISINTVSRKQAQVSYKNNKWLIQDGESGRESANGTWQSFQGYSEKKLDLAKENTKQIDDQMEIKIQENILKFEFINFGKTKKYILFIIQEGNQIIKHLKIFQMDE